LTFFDSFEEFGKLFAIFAAFFERKLQTNNQIIN
jgi:hypothetical protein